MTYRETLDYIQKKEAAGELIAIRPAERLPIGQMEHDPNRLREAYEIGRRTAEAQLDNLKKFLA